VPPGELAAEGEESMPDTRGLGVLQRRVEVMILAVPAAVSNQGIISRYLEQVAGQGHGPLNVQANADRAYLGVLAGQPARPLMALAGFPMVVSRAGVTPDQPDRRRLRAG